MSFISRKILLGKSSIYSPVLIFFGDGIGRGKFQGYPYFQFFLTFFIFMFFLNAILKLHVGINLPCLIFLGNFCILEFILHTNEYILFKLDMFFLKFLFLCFNFLNRNLLILKCLIFIRIVTVYTLTEQLQLI